MWQKCPICKGTGSTLGVTPNAFSSSCPTCNGARVISEITGLPPKHIEQGKIKCTGNEGNGCFLDSCGHNCGCLGIQPKP